MKSSKNIFLLSSLSLVILTSCLFATQATESTPEPAPSTVPSTDRSIYKEGLIPEYQNIVEELPYASMYEIKFNIAEDMIHITGEETVVYTNAENVGLTEVKFRLFPNILGGSMHVDEVFVNDEPIIPNYTLDDSVLSVPFKEPLQPKESVILRMEFKIIVPQSVDLNYGMQAYYDNVLALAHAYPMIAVYDDEGWNAEIPPQWGDLIYADMSFFLVTVEAPREITLAGTGREISRQNNGNRQTVRYAAGPVRDFYLAGSPDYKVFTKEINGVTLRFHTKGRLKKGAEAALDIAARAVEVFNTRYAPYPYTELDFVSTPTLALGIEYPGMIAITEWIVEPDNELLEATIAHEVGHQWFYSLVGNDQLDDPWLDESLTQFATWQYFSDEHGQAGSEMFRIELEDRWYRVGNDKLPIGSPVSAYNGMEYVAIIYGRGALFFEALRNKMGTEKFDEFMKIYTQKNSWNISTPGKLKTQAEGVCGCDLTPLFAQWIFP